MKTCCILTGSRADWGLMRPVFGAIMAHERLWPQVIVCGEHYPMGTWRGVYADIGLRRGNIETHNMAVFRWLKKPGPIDLEIGEYPDADHQVFAMSTLIGEQRPDYMLILGDRIEALMGAVWASKNGVPIVHLCAGDRAMGIQDDAWRHAIAKLAHLHIATSLNAAMRLMRMGEYHIHQYGSPALDDMPDSDRAWKRLGKPAIVLLQHPLGRPADREQAEADELIRACASIGRTAWLRPNCDPDHKGIVAAMMDHTATENVTLESHLPRADFLGLLRRCEVFVGNSSAATVEAPFLGTRTVLVGSRQQGRGTCVPLQGVADVIRWTMAQDKPRPDSVTHGSGDTGRRVADLLASTDPPPIRKLNPY